ncbi:uncharacterized protein LOC123533758 isoform X2 [Mercenaria mercenaria]|uniref:uncharacterized protein LOC123533758 isoform X2 n=1 Tax=Mercenaria mercenaria TaxID=6596 RepID=UPI00234E9CD8|nr:uncharacterized protein LOC123533758 isoform X2 [Mercenaria mercenaria]
MKLILIALHILTVSFVKGAHAKKLFCNIFSLTIYDPETHYCRDNVVIPKMDSNSLANGEESKTYNTPTLVLNGRHSKTRVPENLPKPSTASITTTESETFFCGDLNLVKYDTKTHKCENGKIVMIRSMVNPTTRMPTTRLPEKSRTTRKEISESTSDGQNSFEMPCRRSDIIDCNGIMHCGNNGTYKCCGFQNFQPKQQTCCRVTSSKYKIHDEKPERNHICCGVNVYPRRKSKAPCQHSSRNDAFLSGKLPKMKRKSLESMICNEKIKFAYHLRITGPHSGEDERYLTARVTQYEWQPDMSTSRRYFIRLQTENGIKIPLDTYSPSRLRRKGFIILSNYRKISKLRKLQC